MSPGLILLLSSYSLNSREPSHGTPAASIDRQHPESGKDIANNGNHIAVVLRDAGTYPSLTEVQLLADHSTFHIFHFARRSKAFNDMSNLFLFEQENLRCANKKLSFEL